MIVSRVLNGTGTFRGSGRSPSCDRLIEESVSSRGGKTRTTWTRSLLHNVTRNRGGSTIVRSKMIGSGWRSRTSPRCSSNTPGIRSRIFDPLFADRCRCKRVSSSRHWQLLDTGFGPRKSPVSLKNTQQRLRAGYISGCVSSGRISPFASLSTPLIAGFHDPCAITQQCYEC